MVKCYLQSSMFQSCYNFVELPVTLLNLITSIKYNKKEINYDYI